MVRYLKNFKKTVWGRFEVEADSPEEAEKKWEDADYDEYDNKSDYDMDEEWVKDE